MAKGFSSYSSSKFALAEYIGKFPGLATHGNAKSGDSEYSSKRYDGNGGNA